jgi:hypothetical protein
LSPESGSIQKALGYALLQNGQRAEGARALYLAWKVDHKAIETEKLFALLGALQLWKMAAEVGAVAAEVSGNPVLLMQYGVCLIQSGESARGRRILETLTRADLPADLQKEIRLLLKTLTGPGSADSDPGKRFTQEAQITERPMGSAGSPPIVASPSTPTTTSP